ncbi:MAG: DUF3726 domain-containing protein [Pikeienuella sp.]
MIVSRNEVHGVLRKAGLGAKVAAGTADDLANATSWMEARGVGAMASALDYLASGQAAQLNFATVFDRIATGESAVVVEAADTLLIGFAAGAAGAYGMTFSIEWDGAQAIVGADGYALDAAVAVGTAKVARGGHVAATPLLETIEIDDALWARANKMAAEYYVPATEASRLGGAGAGVNDND